MVSRLLIEYDGGGFYGWARQPGRRTVQGELEQALAMVLREPVELTVAGRTDRGVHAWGQVASYPGPPARVGSLNALLAPDVAVLHCGEAQEGFDARHDAVSRTYCYRVIARPARSALKAGRALWWPHQLDFDALGECAAMLAGEHDFTAFTPTETSHRRFEREVLTARWERSSISGGELLAFWIEADSFMRQMNRALVGTMLEVAGGQRTARGFAELLSGAPRAAAGRTAPAHGLALARVRYRAVGRTR
jgi:tRNA pseudouridine38-40 synthase